MNWDSLRYRGGSEGCNRPLIKGRCDLDKKEELELRIEEIKEELEAARINRIKEIKKESEAARIDRRKQEFLVRKVTSPFRILPTFLIIGVSKGGTTSLFEYLIQHPDIEPPWRKEVNYFNRLHGRFFEYLGLYWYKSFFPTVLETYQHRVNYKRKLITGEATTHYIFNQNKNIPAMVQRLMPSVKLVALLRHPIDRAYSHYQMFVKEGKEPLVFEDAIKCELTPKTQRKKIFFSQGLTQEHPYSYLARGFYVDQLIQWEKCFSKRQFLILQTDELNLNPQRIVNRVFRFLGIPEYELTDLTKHNVGSYPEMSSDTRKMLIKYFRPYNERLGQHLNWKFDWDR